MRARPYGRLLAFLALAAAALLAIGTVAPSALASESALGTLTVKGKTTPLMHVVATREGDPDDPDRTWLVLLATDRPVAPADRAPARLRALAAENALKGVRICWAEGYDRVEVAPYHTDLAVSGMRGPDRPTLNLNRLDEKRVEAEFRSKMVGQDWHFQVRVAAPLAKGGVFEAEPEATIESRDAGAGASPEVAKKRELGKLGYEYTEEMFFSAVTDGDAPAVKLFLDLGMSPNTKEKAAGHVLVAATTACAAQKESSGEIVRLLLAAGANAKAADENNASALVWAVQTCPVEVVKALIRAGAEVNAKAKGGGTALMLAEAFKRDDVVKVLKAAGAKN